LTAAAAATNVAPLRLIRLIAMSSRRAPCGSSTDVTVMGWWPAFWTSAKAGCRLGSAGADRYVAPRLLNATGPVRSGIGGGGAAAGAAGPGATSRITAAASATSAAAASDTGPAGRLLRGAATAPMDGTIRRT
jgi:hypothetical protein